MNLTNKKKIKIVIIGAVVIFALILLCLLNKSANVISTSNKTQNKYEILVDVEESKLYLLNNKHIEKVYSCSGGKWSTPSPIGTWKIIQKATWGEGFRGALDGTKCSLGKFWNSWDIGSIFGWMGKLTWLY